jgi:hypothetical protein
MRKVITGAFVSLDGVMQAPGGPQEDPTRGFKFGGWVWPYTDEVFGQAVDKMFGQPFDLLLGRKTLRDLRGALALCRGRRARFHRQAVQPNHEVRRDALDHGPDVGGFGRAA